MREKGDFHDHLASKDEEIERMRSMISTKHANQTDQVMELEVRLQSLTDTLIQKQAALEASKADYHSLQVLIYRFLLIKHLVHPTVAYLENGFYGFGIDFTIFQKSIFFII